MVSKNVAEIQTINGTFRRSSDVISYLDITVDIAKNMNVTEGRVNYAKYTDTNRTRYFFIDSYDETINGIVTLHLHEDVLSTFPTNVRDSSGVFVRAGNGNPYLNDGTFKTLGSSNVSAQPFGSSFNVSPTYLLTVAGG